MKASQQAGMLCGEAQFWAFLKESENLKRFAIRFPDERWPFLRSKEDAAIAVRYLLGVDSRRDLDTDHEAALNWRNLVEEYELWKGNAND